jgi:UDP-N-acetylmuramoyl-L-alanyl-D-glutamate--2,6-diaminopimelate ligase
MPRLKDLAAAIGAHATGDTALAGIAVDSRAVAAGDLFVALPGFSTDGENFIDEARRRGAAAVMAREPDPHLPTLIVDDPRERLPLLASAFYGDPSRLLRLIGVTGTLGKTSTASFLQAVLRAAGEESGMIGSLGISIGDRVLDTGMTTPDAPVIHAAFREMVDAGLRSAVMEVTSHALLLHRTDGLVLSLGVLTNLVPDEHLEFHPTPEHYLQTKLRFLDLLAPEAPLVVNLDNALADKHTRARGQPRVGVSWTPSSDAAVTVENVTSGVEGSRFRLRIRKPLAGPGGEVEAQDIDVFTPLLGNEQICDMALGATAALLAGAGAEAVLRAAAAMRPLRRRMELLQAWPMLLDDTTGNPRSLIGVFDFVKRLAITGTTRVVFGLRGMRGTAINAALMETLARLVQESGAELTLTASSDVADDRNRVQPDECRAALDTLTQLGVTFRFEPELGAAIAHALHDIAPDDFVLLLGAQGMDQAADLARACLRTPRTAS